MDKLVNIPVRRSRAESNDIVAGITRKSAGSVIIRIAIRRRTRSFKILRIRCGITRLWSRKRPATTIHWITKRLASTPTSNRFITRTG
ncbi:hypothetical protein HanIR_Chr07g0317561 [Helianthus annuus]|nr:hypothetical protein HanIR_Chr07g0317561 [Helianthus annuus]